MARDVTSFYLSSKEFLAKYPFHSRARGYVTLADLSVDELVRGGGELVVAERRIVRALERGEDAGAVMHSDDPDEEIVSFPMAVLLAAAVGDRWLQRRLALYESRRAEAFLQSDDDAALHEVLSDLGITASRCGRDEEDRTGYPYKISVADYLRLIRGLDGAEWRLVNRTVWRGWVFTTRSELVRLVAEEIESRILRRLEEVKVPRVPEQIREVVERIRGMLASRYARRLPSAEVSRDEATWPPCMLALKSALLSGSKVGHFGNFAFAAFLLSAGYSVEDVVSFYAQRPDFNERIARYQVEHIAGMRGSRTKYSVPSCQTMRAHGLCIEDGRLCPKGIRNPRQYARLRGRTTG
ncbi:MAG: DNA primase large subunit PriL [Nitrososphaerota archaeon]|nr:DNA primase large subunit PriL [Candidatus Calditenuis fumarioli]